MTASSVPLDKYLDRPLDFRYLLFTLPFFFTFDLNYYLTFALIALFGIFLFEKLGSGILNLFVPDLISWFLLLVWGLYQVTASIDKGNGFFYYTTLIIVPFFMFIMINNFSLDIKFIDKFFKLLFLSGFIATSYSVYQLSMKGFEFSTRIPSFWTHYNLVAGYFMLLFFFNLSFIVNSKFTARSIPYVISLLIILFGLLTTQTRGIWMSTLAGIVFYIFKKPRLLIPTSALLLLVFAFFSDIIIDRALSVVNFGYDVSSIGRLQAWIASGVLISENPILGYGFDAFRYLRDRVFVAYFVILPHPHNTYLTLALDLGVIGLILYLHFFFKAFYYSVRMRIKSGNSELNKYFDGMQLTFVGFIVAFMFEPYFTILGSITFVLWFIMSLSYAFRFGRISFQ